MNKFFKNIKKISEVLNIINTFILMLIIFLLVFIPIGLIRRLLTKSYFFKYDNVLTSYFKNSKLKKSSKVRNYYEKPF